MNRLSKKKIKMIPDEGLHIIGLWNLMVILIPFLLLSAVVSQTSILNLYVPTGATDGLSEAKGLPPLIVSITPEGFRIQNGETILPFIPKKGDRYDMAHLSSALHSIKEESRLQENIVLLSDPDVPYEILVGVMDTSRERIIFEGGSPQIIPLFPNISIGEMSE